MAQRFLGHSICFDTRNNYSSSSNCIAPKESVEEILNFEPGSSHEHYIVEVDECRQLCEYIKIFTINAGSHGLEAVRLVRLARGQLAAWKNFFERRDNSWNQIQSA